MKKILPFLIALNFILPAYSFAAIQNGNIELEKIVISSNRYGQSLDNVASSVTVITEENIEHSNAQTIPDVLRYVPGVIVRDWYSNGSKAVVDMVGFGEQAGYNVLVLVDGRRVNDVDLSGVDWSQIPLEQVEKIEVIRGGAGSVLYGDNAASGVINIITKKGSGKPKAQLKMHYGSYGMNAQKVSLEGAVKKLSFWFNIGRDALNGYRDNSYNKAQDFASKLEYKLNDVLSMCFSSGFHAATYALPSGLFQHHIDENGRRWARYGDDHANNKDYFFVFGPKIDVLDSGHFNVDFNYRQKDTNSYFPTSGNDTQRNRIKTVGVLPKYVLTKDIFDHGNKIVTGLDFYRVFFTLNNYVSPNDINWKNYTNISKNSIGGYFLDEFSILENLILSGGYRYEAVRYGFNYHDFTNSNPDRGGKLSPNMEAFNSGLVYNYKDDSSVFANVGKSFRFPEVDEFTGQNDLNFHQYLNTNLKPQSAINYQLGVRHKFSDKLNGSVSLYRMNVKNYLYFNPAGGVFGFGENENYDKSIHQGLESSLNTKLNNWVDFFGSYTFTNAYFVGGQYAKNEIPMVPRHKGNVGLKFSLPKNFKLNVSGNHVGKRYFINDQANAVSRLNGYMTADTNLSWHSKDLTISFGINNLFNKEYSEYGVYGSDSSRGFVNDKCYFPSPTRNFNLKISYDF